MAPKRLIDFLRVAECFHQDLSTYCTERSRESQREEVRMLLNYVARHEEALAKLIEEFEHGASKELLEHWFKISPDLSFVDEIDETEFRPDMTLEEIAPYVVRMDEALLAMYRVLLDQAVSDELRQLLESLISQEQTEEIKMLRGIDEAQRG